MTQRYRPLARAPLIHPAIQRLIQLRDLRELAKVEPLQERIQDQATTRAHRYALS